MNVDLIELNLYQQLRAHVKSHEQIKEVLTCPRENCDRSYLKVNAPSNDSKEND